MQRDGWKILVIAVCVFFFGIQEGAAQPARQWVTPNVEAPRLKQVLFDSAAAKTKVSYFIYTPEAYDTEKDRRFPVLYWLHGSGGGMRGLQPLTHHFDGAMRAGKMPPMIVVFPNGLADGMWCNSKDGKTPMETVVIKELIPHIDASYRTIASRDGRILEGFSMGGYGAGRLGLKYHDLFAAVSMIAGGPLQPEFKVSEAPRANPQEAQRLLNMTYGGDQAYFKAQSPWVTAEQNAAGLQTGTLIRQVVGDADEVYANNRKFHDHLMELHIPHAYVVVPGVGHNPGGIFQGLGEANWQFYHQALVNLPAR